MRVPLRSDFVDRQAERRRLCLFERYGAIAHSFEQGRRGGEKRIESGLPLSAKRGDRLFLARHRQARKIERRIFSEPCHLSRTHVQTRTGLVKCQQASASEYGQSEQEKQPTSDPAETATRVGRTCFHKQGGKLGHQNRSRSVSTFLHAVR